MTLELIEEELIKNFTSKSVSEVDEIPLKDFEEFLNLYKSNKIKIGIKYDGDLVEYFGKKSEVIMHYILVWSPLIISLLLTIMALITTSYIILWGIPLTILGFILSSPFFMKGLGSAIWIFGFIAFIYLCFKSFNSATILGAYIFTNFLVTVSREQCRIIVNRTILKSELVFVWLFTQGSIYVQKTT